MSFLFHTGFLFFIVTLFTGHTFWQFEDGYIEA
jgi:hypothetical protein